MSDIVDGDGGFGLSHKEYVCFTCQAQIKAISGSKNAEFWDSGNVRCDLSPALCKTIIYFHI